MYTGRPQQVVMIKFGLIAVIRWQFAAIDVREMIKHLLKWCLRYTDPSTVVSLTFCLLTG